ncbi:L-lactate oxidase-like [Amblyomma americanum]
MSIVLLPAAAQEAGTVMILSTPSTVSLEDVRAGAPDCILWQQLFIFGDRSLTEPLVERASARGYAAIVLTVDSPVPGDGTGRHQSLTDLPGGLSFANLLTSPKDSKSSTEKNYSECFPAIHARDTATLKDLEWLCSISELPVVVKAVLTGASYVNFLQTYGPVLEARSLVQRKEGVRKVLDILKEELERTIRLLDQLEAMLCFIEQHAGLGRGASEAMPAETRQRLWVQLAAELNGLGPATRSPEGWKRFWQQQVRQARTAGSLVGAEHR